MHITLEADYAVRIVGCLAALEQRADAKTISEETCVSLRFALKILNKLSANGLVRSFKGKKGGYELAKPPSEISIMDVIKTVEGNYYLSRCLSPEHDCSRGMSGCCKYQKIFDDISADVEKKLSSYTFDMLK